MVAVSLEILASRECRLLRAASSFDLVEVLSARTGPMARAAISPAAATGPRHAAKGMLGRSSMSLYPYRTGSVVVKPCLACLDPAPGSTISVDFGNEAGALEPGSTLARGRNWLKSGITGRPRAGRGPGR